MKQKQIKLKKFVMELNFRIQMCNYSFKFGVKQVCMVAILLFLTRVIFWLFKEVLGKRYKDKVNL